MSIIANPSGGGFEIEQSNFNNFSASSTVQWSHNKSKKPMFVQLVLKCTAANLGYSVDDQLILSPTDSHYSNRGFVVDATSNDVLKAYVGSGGLAFIVKGGGAGSTLADLTKWQMRFRAVFA